MPRRCRYFSGDAIGRDLLSRSPRRYRRFQARKQHLLRLALAKYLGRIAATPPACLHNYANQNKFLYMIAHAHAIAINVYMKSHMSITGAGVHMPLPLFEFRYCARRRSWLTHNIGDNW